MDHCTNTELVEMPFMYEAAQGNSSFTPHRLTALELIKRLFSTVRNAAFFIAIILRYLPVLVPCIEAYNDLLTHNYLWKRSNVRLYSRFLPGNRSMYIFWAATLFPWSNSYVKKVQSPNIHLCKIRISVTMHIARNPCGEWRLNSAKPFLLPDSIKPSTAITQAFRANNFYMKSAYLGYLYLYLYFW